MGFVRVCGLAELPPSGEMRELALPGGWVVCVVNDGGKLHAVDNVCPNGGGPLAEGTLEQGKVLCPWHAWAFDLRTGEADHDAGERVQVYTIRVAGQDAEIDLPEN